jgi:hypothetical protein
VALMGLASDFFAGRHWQKEKFQALSAFYISILDSNFNIFGPHSQPQITKYGKYGNA